MRATTLLLSDEHGRAVLTLKDVTSRESPVRKFEAHPGCNCDRWGHPCPGCVERDLRSETKARFHDQ